MGEAGDAPRPNPEATAGGIPAKEYREAHGLLYRYATREDVTAGITCADDILKDARGLGRALNTVIRANGTRTPNGTPDQYSFHMPLEQIPSYSPGKEKGTFIAITDGVVISLTEAPFKPKDPRQLPAETTFVTIPVDDMDWNIGGAEVPSVTLGDVPAQYPLQQPEDGGLAQLYASTLRQGVEKLINAVEPPSPPSPPRHAK